MSILKVNIDDNESIEDFIKNGLNEREKLALKEAVKVLYFDDSSDYGTALFKIVYHFLGDKISEDEDSYDVVEKLFDILEDE